MFKSFFVEEVKKNSILTCILTKLLQLLKQYCDILVFAIIVTIKVVYFGRIISSSFAISFLRRPALYSISPIIGISFLFSFKHRKYFLFTINLIVSLILLADTVYYRYFKDLISIGTIKDAFLLKDVSTSVIFLLKPKDFLYFTDILVLPLLIKFVKRIFLKDSSIYKRLIPFFFIFFFGMVLNGKLIYNLSVEQTNLISTMYNKVYIAKALGTINYHFIDIYNYISTGIQKNKRLEEGRKKEIYTFLNEKIKPEEVMLKGAYSGKNLIVVQIEALQNFVINQRINGAEITPNLNQWIKKSLYFDNYFYQVAAGNTSDAEFLSNNSLYPASTGAAYYKYSTNTFNSLPKALFERGYDTAAFHGYSEGFWNRNIMYKTLGFNSFYGGESFIIDEELGLGLSDKSFFMQSLEIIKTLEKPFYSYMITLSSHFPYNGLENYDKLNIEGYENTLLGNYMKSIHYTDAQIGMFLNRLEEESILNESIVVIYGDHSAIPKEYMNELYAFDNVENPTELDWFQYQKVPMLIHFPMNAHNGIESTCSGQIDLYPTLANLLGLENKYMLGKDILNASDQKVIFRDGSFIDGEVFYQSSTNTYYDLLTGNILSETSKLKKLKEEALNELKYSDDILNHDLIKSYKSQE